MASISADAVPSRCLPVVDDDKASLVMAWLKENAATVIGWVIVISVSLGGRLATIDASDYAQEALADDVRTTSARVTRLESDVRLLDQTVKRQEQVVTRQEEAQKDLDRLVVELKTVVEVGRND